MDHGGGAVMVGGRWLLGNGGWVSYETLKNFYYLGNFIILINLLMLMLTCQFSMLIAKGDMLIWCFN